MEGAAHSITDEDAFPNLTIEMIAPAYPSKGVQFITAARLG